MGIENETSRRQRKEVHGKAHCCLRGGRQQAYVDYDPTDIYAPVASHDSIQVPLAIAAAQNLTLEGADNSNAYLYGDLDISILIEQPTDSTKRHAMPGHVCKLKKSLYGTKQAGDIWGSLLDKSLKVLASRTPTTSIVFAVQQRHGLCHRCYHC